MIEEKTTTELLAHATMYVGIKKITKKNAKLFNQRLKILRFAGLHIFDTLTLLYNEKPPTAIFFSPVVLDHKAW